MAVRLSVQEQDKKDLDKFTNFFVFKSLQIIVQSRLGEKLKYKSRVTSSSIDWFNLAITDIPEVQAEAKKTLLGQQPLLSQTVNVEISLRTVEGASMVLETWSLTMNTEQPDPGIKISSTVYNRMTVALKAIFSVSRMPPAYRLSRRQGGNNPDDFVICYRIYLGLPHTGHLGDDYKTTRVGAVPTPVGTIVINLAFRTNLLMPQNMAKRGMPFVVKDDHFGMGPQATEPRPCFTGFKHPTSAEDLRRLEGMDSPDLCAAMFSTSPCDMATFTNTPPSPSTKTTEMRSSDKDDFENLYRVGAFIQDEVRPVRRERPEDRPFAALMSGLPLSNIQGSGDGTTTSDSESEKGEEDLDEKEEEDNEMESKVAELESSDSGSVHEDMAKGGSPSADEFVMVSLKTPFAATDPTADLGQFYRELQEAPDLDMCKSVVVTDDFLSELKDEIDLLASRQPEFNAFIKSLSSDSEHE